MFLVIHFRIVFLGVIPFTCPYFCALVEYVYSTAYCSLYLENWMFFILAFSGLLFSKFRVGWKMIIHAIPQKPSSNSFQTFMVIASKEAYGEVHQITSFVDISSRNRSVNQVGCSYNFQVIDFSFGILSTVIPNIVTFE